MEESGSAYVYDAIDRAIHKEKENYRINALEIKRTRHFGLRTLLLSMMDIEKDHVRKLMELRRKPHLLQYFDKTQWNQKLDYKDLFKDVHFGDSMAYLDFLTMVILREEKMATLYKFVGKACLNEEITFLFKTLEENNRKKRSWALDRYELEILTFQMNG